MLLLEKLFQQNDKIFLIFTNIFNFFIFYIVSYCLIILKYHSIYELLEVKLFIESPEFIFINYILLFIYIVSNLFITSYYNFNYKEYLTRFIFNLFISFSVFFFLISDYKISFFIVIYPAILFVISIFSKYLLNKVYRFLVSQNHIQRNIAVVGYEKDIFRLHEQEIFKYNNICKIIVPRDNANYKSSFTNIPVLEIKKDPIETLSYHEIGEIWFLTRDNKLNVSDEQYLDFLSTLPVDVKIVSFSLLKNLNLNYSKANELFFYNFECSKFHGLSLLIKVIFDKLLSIFFILLSLPILFLASLIIIVEDGFPFIFTQQRLGWDGRKFTLYKLRTLKKNNLEPTKQVTSNDKRVLFSGKIIRKLSLDELPQFINVLIGDMSIVGPRPLMIEHNYQYSELILSFMKRNKCYPGITGLAQVNGFRGATPTLDLMSKRFEYDLIYIKKWSFFLDMLIILRTFYAIFKYGRA